MTLLITGSSGFLGSELSRQLVLRGSSFDVLTRTGIFRNGEKILDCFFDLADGKVPGSKYLVEYSELVHLAWYGLPNYKSQLHLRQLSAHKAFLLNAVEAGVTSIFVAGTCLEYGLAEGPLTKLSVPAPTSAYGKAKLELLDFIDQLHKERDFSYCWGRFFYIYGVGQKENSLYPTMLRALRNNTSIELHSSGKQIRDFIPVEEACFAVLKILEEGSNHKIVNIGSGNPMSVADWLRKIIPIDNKTQIEFLGQKLPDYEPFASWAADHFKI